MNTKTLTMLVVVLAVLAGLVALNRARRPARPAAAGAGGARGAKERVLPALDVNAVARLVVAGSKTSELARAEGRWTAASLYGYPADFEKIVRALRSLEDLKVGQVVREGEKYLADFGLVPPADTNAPAGDRRTVRCLDEGGKELASLTIGNAYAPPRSAGGFGGGGNYVRAGDGPVAIVSESLYDLSVNGTDWVKRELTSVPSTDLTNLSISVSNETVELTVAGYDNYQAAGLAADEEIVKEAANKAAGALAYLSFSQVADPSKKAEELGLDGAARYTAVTRDGRTYTVTVGAETADKDGRYAKLAVSYQKPPPPPPPAAPAVTNDAASATNAAAGSATNEAARILKEYEENTAKTAKVVDDQKALFERWTYVLVKYDCENLLQSRAQVIKKKETPQPEASTNAPPAVAAPPEPPPVPPAAATNEPAPAVTNAPPGVGPAAAGGPPASP